MEFTLIQDFPAGLDRLWATFGQAAYVERKYQSLGATAVRLLRFEATAQSIEVELERDVPVDAARLPPWAQRFIGAEQTLRHRSIWRRTSAAHAVAEIDIVPLGLPVHAQGAGAVDEGVPGSTRLVLAWQVDSRLPLVGARVERLFGEQVRKALDDDHRFTLAYLRPG